MDYNTVNNTAKDPGKVMAIVSLILGILGLLTGWLLGLGCILGIVAIILAIISGNKSQAAGFSQSGLAIIGLVCGIIAIVAGAGCLACTVCYACTEGASLGIMGCAGLMNGLASDTASSLSTYY